MPVPANLFPLADLDLVAMMGVMIPIIAMMIPIVVIFTNHQRKMAEIIHQGNRVQPGELEAIRHELQALRTQMNQQTIALDDMRNRAPQQTDIQQRIGSS